MSKKEVKAALKDLDREQLSELILEIYSSVKGAKEYLDFYANPDEEKKAEEVKAGIFREIFPMRRRKKIKFAPSKRLIADFARLRCSPRLVLDLMLYLVETARQAERMGRAGSESFHSSLQKNVLAAHEYAEKHGLEEEFRPRLQAALHWL